MNRRIGCVMWNILFLVWLDPSSEFQPRSFKTKNHRESSVLCTALKRPKSPSHSALVPEEEKLTSFLLHLSYDGGRFRGWSAANDGNNATFPRRRRRTRKGRAPVSVRSIEGILRHNVAKIYGNLDPERIVIEACSRTDKGVHARGMVVQVYCLAPDVVGRLRESLNCTLGVGDSYSEWRNQPSIPGKRLPHPMNATDDTSCFTKLPVTLSKLSFALNRMCFEMCVIAAASVPAAKMTTGDEHFNGQPIPFHPTRSAKQKTYQYTLSMGPIHDPVHVHRLWHLHDLLDLHLMRQACTVLEGTHNFAAFQGAPRGSDDKRKRINQNSTCTLLDISVDHQLDSPWYQITNTSNVIVTITGDRFLYKMVRFLVGSVVAVGSRKLNLADLEKALSTGERLLPWECAPACGLVLQNVKFEEAIEWESATS